MYVKWKKKKKLTTFSFFTSILHSFIILFIFLIIFSRIIRSLNYNTTLPQKKFADTFMIILLFSFFSFKCLREKSKINIFLFYFFVAMFCNNLNDSSTKLSNRRQLLLIEKKRKNQNENLWWNWNLHTLGK